MNPNDLVVYTWLRVASVADVPEDGTLWCWVNGHAVCLYNINGTIYATDDACSHGEASLADGFIVNGDQIECPYHQGRFHVPSGKAVRSPCIADIRTYRVRIKDDAVLLDSAELVASPSA